MIVATKHLSNFQAPNVTFSTGKTARIISAFLNLLMLRKFFQNIYIFFFGGGGGGVLDEFWLSHVVQFVSREVVQTKKKTQERYRWTENTYFYAAYSCVPRGLKEAALLSFNI